MEPNKYELGVVIRADLEEDALRAEMDRVKGLIERFGGTIEKVDDWGRRKLAYPIMKLAEGMYTFITYTSEGSTPKEVESRLRIMENVLRFMTVRKDEVEAAPVKAAKPAKPVQAASSEEAAPAPEVSSEEAAPAPEAE